MLQSLGSKIQRSKWEDIDWSKYGNNGIQDPDTKKYLESMGIDAEREENYGSLLEKKLANQIQLFSVADDWAVGTKHTGMCDITQSWFVPSEGQSYFILDNFRDGLEGVEMVGAGWCANHTAAEPPAGHKVVRVECTVTRIDPDGWVYMSLLLIPDGVTDGVTSNEFGLIGYQRIAANVRIKKEFTGSVYLKKISANTVITSNNDCYSLSGAEYGVYSDSSCKTKVGTLTTNASGESNTLEVNAGNYWVKETKAPKGFVLDPNVYKVTVTSGKTATVSVQDIPTMDPVGILLGKVDRETNQNKPQGSASLQGALFTVKYYKDLYDTDPAEQGKTPERTWVFRTDSDGFCEYQKEYFVSGDELYYAASGDPSLPLGTITIQETQAPEGYLINPEIYVAKITSNNAGQEFVYTYNEPTVPETVLQLDIVKILKDTEQVIPGAVFKHTSPDGSMQEIKTDKNGKAVIKGLTWGTHTIEEVSVPDGFTVNPGKVIFNVEKGNKITVISNTAVETTGSMTFVVGDDGCIDLKVEDILAPYQLTVHKQNEDGKLLQGAEFAIFEDEACTKELQRKSSNENGELFFEGLTVNQKYYLKEIKAPKGYRLPLQTDGRPVVYEIYTTSNPVKDEFAYYVNGKKYTESTGLFAITGTKADREVNLTVENHTGIKMPETGTSIQAGMLLLGIGCLAGAIVWYIRKGKKRDEEKKNSKTIDDRRNDRDHSF